MFRGVMTGALLLWAGAAAYGQANVYLAAFDSATIKAADTGRNSGYLKLNERDVLLWVNIVRVNPKDFLNKCLNPWLQAKGMKTNKWIKSLQAELAVLAPLPALRPDSILQQAARTHAADLGRTGAFSHTGSNGLTLEKRLTRFGFTKCWAENLSGGIPDPMEMLLDLLIDEDVKGTGHRKNILSPLYGRVGVAIGPHPTLKPICVQDFSCL